MAWDVVVANRGPSAATGVRVRVTLPGDTTFVSSSCVAYDSGLHRSSCEFNPNLGVSELEPIPPGTAVALLILTKADAVGSTELRAEVVGLEQPDLDSSPLDRTGDDIDADEILVTVDAVEGSTGDGGSGAVPGGSLPIWPVALLAVVAVAAIALAWRPTFWRLR